MLFSTRLGAAVLTTLLTLPLAQTQLVASFPQCVQTCISQSGDDNCSVLDVKCLCRASNGNFLPDTITCMHGNCDNDLDTDLFIKPLQLACEIAGTPISSEAIQNAENEASSLASQVTTTVTATVGESGKTSSVATTASAQSVVTLTTTASGLTVAIVYPVFIESTTTVYGSPSTTLSATVSSMSGSSESTASASTSTSVVPVVITNSEGSTITGTTTKPESIPSGSSTLLDSTKSDSISSTITQITSIDAQDASSTSKSTSSKTRSSYTVPTNGDILNGDVDSIAPKEMVESSMGLLIAIVACLVVI